ncbi:HEPN domain-containing protein [Thermodesulfovibrio sp.]|uniref:HEPN domain-containing protein n=1 Tax=Thermodesulfovibrio sp. TaxID=2067987 RepID=UPI00261AB06A|nr:HEPN domain-containing protein [Thermodesulfovibrio sp.]
MNLSNFNWEEYLSLAIELESQSKDPNQTIKHARLRSSISRAYYSAFCICRNYLKHKEGKKLPKDQSIHKIVIEDFLNSNDITKREIGDFLKKLRQQRNKADYDDTFSNPEKTTSYSILLASDIIEKIKLLYHL